MMKLYGVYRSRASRNIWFANELSVPFEHVPIIQAYRLSDPDAAGAPLNTRSPSFLKIAPNGQIPVLVDGDVVIAQSLAINLYLARKHGGPLAPDGPAEVGQTAQWTLWAATEVETPAITILYNRIGKPPAERYEAAALAAIEVLKPKCAVLDAHLARTGDYLVGNRFTVCDANVAEVMRYAQAAPELLAPYRHLTSWLARCQSRPAFKAMMAKREAEPA
jgi:glutathione S-transferase